jgi:DNA-binding Xre family transcriptional regulator
MLVIIESYLGSTLTVEERKKAIEIKTLNDICKYVEELAQTRNLITE